MSKIQADRPNQEPKRPYETPALRKLGSVPGVTATQTGSGPDQVYVNGPS